MQSALLAELFSLPTGLASNLHNQRHACGEAEARNELWECSDRIPFPSKQQKSQLWQWIQWMLQRRSTKFLKISWPCRGDLVSLTIRQTCLIHAPSSGQTHKPSHRPCRKLCSFFLVPKSRTSTVADSLVKPWMAFELGFCKETLSSPDSVFEDFEAQA